MAQKRSQITQPSTRSRLATSTTSSWRASDPIRAARPLERVPLIVYLALGIVMMAGEILLGGTAGFGAFVALFTFGVGAMIATG
jgi:hypothetical protein